MAAYSEKSLNGGGSPAAALVITSAAVGCKRWLAGVCRLFDCGPVEVRPHGKMIGSLATEIRNHSRTEQLSHQPPK